MVQTLEPNLDTAITLETVGTQDVSPEQISIHDSEISGLESSSMQLLAAFAMVLVDQILRQSRCSGARHKCCNRKFFLPVSSLFFPYKILADQILPLSLQNLFLSN
ncbi:hypothetical protein OIU84_019914 [Salix udensis]|uniref:Uncharacterized protein n=1 Tax=Salix udensis TaxID=889485 RepID=A0AAD6L1S6_9ROSI|nr:hypothetical protein OIU84_019914 [Salix udensis]